VMIRLLRGGVGVGRGNRISYLRDRGVFSFLCRYY
jgi:hypothetical protein